jgi:hypothetical protein
MPPVDAAVGESYNQLIAGAENVVYFDLELRNGFVAMVRNRPDGVEPHNIAGGDQSIRSGSYVNRRHGQRFDELASREL